MGKKSFTSSQKVISIILILTAIVIAVTTVVLAAVSYSKVGLEEEQATLDELLNNWKQGPILDIKAAITCPDGYVPAFTKKFPGVAEACYCRGVSADTQSANGFSCGDFCAGTCTTAMTTAGCTPQSAIPATDLKYWGVDYSSGSARPMQLCLKRSTTESWFTNGVLSGGTCPDGYKTCGTDADTKYCTKEATCPIIAIIASQSTVNDNLNCNSGATPNCVGIITIPGGTSKKISFYTVDSPPMPGYKGLPLSQFRVNEWGMCYNSTKDNITPGRLQYPNLNQKYTTCDDEATKSELYVAGDFNTEANYFGFNGIAIPIAGLANFKTEGMDAGYYPTDKSGASYNYKLFQQSYVPWKAEYREDMQTFIDNVNLIKWIKQSQKGFLSITVIATFFLLLVATPIEFLILCGKVDVKGKLNKFKRIINMFFKFAQIPIIVWALLVVAVGKHYFHKVSENQASTKAYVNHGFHTFSEHLTQPQASTAACLALVVAGWILDCVIECYMRRAAKKAKKAERIDSETNNINAKSSQAIDHESPTKTK